MGQHQRFAWHDICSTSHEVQICPTTSSTCHSSSHYPQQPIFPFLEISLESWLLLGRPAVNASESSCAHFLDARLELFWAEDWSALWAMVRAECDVAPVQNSVRRTEKQQTQSRIRKVATLARAGEKGRALAAARNAPPVPVTEQIVQEIKIRASTPLIQSHQQQNQIQYQLCSCLKLLSRSHLRFGKCPGSVNQDLSVCVLNTGTILAL